MIRRARRLLSKHCEHTLSRVGRLVYSNESVRKLKHVISVMGHILKLCRTKEKEYKPKGDDDELCVFRPLLDVMGDNGDISKVESSVDFVHEV